MICDECQALYEEVGDRVRDAKVFAKVRRTDTILKCKADGIESEAIYFVDVDLPDHKKVWIGLFTEDRWLSESIEADLMHLGDKIDELLEEELIELGFDKRLPVEHFRDEEKRYVFRSAIDLPNGEVLDGETMIDQTTKVLLAYEACFSQLGDMKTNDEL